MNPIIEEFTLTLKYQVSVNTETGEMTTKCISRKVDKANFEVSEDKPKKKTSKSKDESSKPTLILEDNKYCLNQAAINLMEIQPGDKLDIKYEKRDKETIPVIGKDENFGTKQGNKLNKNLSVACRGAKREELIKFGTEFVLIPHETKVGIFILQNEDIKLEDILADEEVPIDVDFQDLIDDKDATITEVSSSLFQL